MTHKIDRRAVRLHNRVEKAKDRLERYHANKLADAESKRLFDDSMRADDFDLVQGGFQRAHEVETDRVEVLRQGFYDLAQARKDTKFEAIREAHKAERKKDASQAETDRKLEELTRARAVSREAFEQAEAEARLTRSIQKLQGLRPEEPNAAKPAKAKRLDDALEDFACAISHPQCANLSPLERLQLHTKDVVRASTQEFDNSEEALKDCTCILGYNDDDSIFLAELHPGCLSHGIKRATKGPTSDATVVSDLVCDAVISMAKAVNVDPRAVTEVNITPGIAKVEYRTHSASGLRDIESRSIRFQNDKLNRLYPHKKDSK